MSSFNLSGLSNLGGGMSNVDFSGALSTGKQALGSITAALATDETQQAVGDTLAFGVEGVKLAGSIFGVDLSGIDSQQVGQVGGSIFGQVADIAANLAGNI